MLRIALTAALLLLSSVASAEGGRADGWTYTAELPDAGGGYATALLPAPSASYNEPSYMIARCLSGRTEFLVGTTGGWGASGQKLAVTFEVGAGEAKASKWVVSTNGKAVFLDDPPEDFLRAISDPGTLRFTVREPSGAVHETVFDTSGFATVRAKIAKACGWTP
ncbi:hypothetical protein [Hansschlegelia sp. KR7-227]|uniref:hypothetical protein n=1 Tax=Hansschlegelia sp. KR7-227 TaxID=3400914 RepID=UPI003C0DDBAD